MDPVQRTASPYTDPNIKGPSVQIKAEGAVDLRKSKSALLPAVEVPLRLHLGPSDL